jgi:peroxiredoxin
LREEFAFGYKGVANRSVFVIDHAGIIKHIEILENPGDLPNFDAVNEVLNSLN